MTTERSGMPTVARLHELFSVSTNGDLVRKISCRSKKATAGDVAGSPNAWGHLKVMVDGQMIYNHQVVWAMTHGEWPTKAIDHVNGLKTDNRPDNLRLASSTENNHNRGVNRNNRTGFRGVSRDSRRNKFQAQITVDGNHMYLGHFDSAEEASRVYEAKARELHGDFYRDQEVKP